MQIQTQTQTLPVSTIQPTAATVDVTRQALGAPSIDSASSRMRPPAEESDDKNNASRQPSEEEMNSALQKINDAVQLVSQKLEFSIDKDTDVFVVKVIDKETKEVIRQMPSEELLNVAKALDTLQGLLIKDKV